MRAQDRLAEFEVSAAVLACAGTISWAKTVIEFLEQPTLRKTPHYVWRDRGYQLITLIVRTIRRLSPVGSHAGENITQQELAQVVSGATSASRDLVLLHRQVFVVLVNDCWWMVPSARNHMAGVIALGTKSVLPVIVETAATGGQLTRREMVGRLLAGMGAGAAWPLVADSHPIDELLRNDAVLEEAEKLDATDWKPVFLNADQNESLIALAEAIVPGSTKAQVNRFVDLLLSVETDAHKKEFVAALAAFEAESQKRFGKGFPSLDDRQQNMLLTDTAAAPAKDDVAGSAGKENSGLHEHFKNLKGWISGAYYSSEMGMRELGWNEDRVFASFPGCEHPEGHH